MVQTPTQGKPMIITSQVMLNHMNTGDSTNGGLSYQQYIDEGYNYGVVSGVNGGSSVGYAFKIGMYGGRCMIQYDFSCWWSSAGWKWLNIQWFCCGVGTTYGWRTIHTIRLYNNLINSHRWLSFNLPVDNILYPYVSWVKITPGSGEGFITDVSDYASITHTELPYYHD